ncbi:uncharacterized protein ACBR49_015813 isoform 3-T3 [Aulostomus maculatus]
MTTVCSPSSAGFQCRCEDPYHWSCDQCHLYGSCDHIVDDTCGCINAIPPDGQYCQPLSELSVCPSTTDSSPNTTTHVSTTTPIMPSSSAVTSSTHITPTNDETTAAEPTTGVPNSTTDIATTNLPDTTASSTPVDTATASIATSSTPPGVQEYFVSIELKTTDVTLIEGLRSIRGNIYFTISVGNIIISDLKMTTVCSPSSAGFQCRCEDPYHWSCDQCHLYGSCDHIVDDTCGCINAIPPDGQYCQPLSELSVCPSTTDSSPNTTTHVSTTTPIMPSSSAVTSSTHITPTNDETTAAEPTTGVPNSTTDIATTNLPDTTASSTPVDTATASIATSSTPPGVQEYFVSIELKTTDVTLIEGLRSIRGNIYFTISVGNIIISDLKMTTVCSPSSAGFQCRCEDPYHWSCDQCHLYGSCDHIVDDTCGCINAIPPDGQYCQPLSELSVCPSTTDSSPNTTTHVSTTTPIMPSSSAVTSSTHITPTNDETTAAEPTTGVPNSTTDIATTNLPDTTASSTPVDTATASIATSSTPPGVQEYFVSIELKTTDVTLIEGLRSIRGNIYFTISVGNIIISDLKMTTVCSPSSAGFQCRCEDPYHWSCDQCHLYGSCDHIVDDTCGCINAIPPDGQYCQPLSELSVCPSTTVSPTSGTKSTVTETTPVSSTHVDSTTAFTTSRNSSPNTTTHVSTTTPIMPSSSAVTSSTHITPTTMETTTAGPTASVPNSTSITTTRVNTTTPIMPSSSAVTSSTHITPTTMETTTAGPTASVPNSTSITTTRVNTTTPIMPSSSAVTISPTSGTKSTVTETTPVSSTHVDSTTAFTTSRNSSPNTTTHVSTTTPIMPSSSAVTSSTHITPTTMETTTAGPTASVPNSTSITTTHVSTTTPIMPSSSAVTSSTHITPTTMETTTAGPTANVPNSSPKTTTHVSTTTPIMPSSSAVTSSTHITPTTMETTRPGPTASVPSFAVEMSLRLDLNFTAELNNKESPVYKHLEDSLVKVFQQQYKIITGYVGVSLTRFRNGSVIADYVVRATQLDAQEIAEVNKKLPDEMKSIADVIGSVSALYNSPNPIDVRPTYTGRTMTMACPPGGIDVGNISKSIWTHDEWEVKDSRRTVITTSARQSVLVVNNVISADVGHYKCTLDSEVMNFIQRGYVTREDILTAPIVQLQSEINVECEDGKIQPLQCCVQSFYEVIWTQGNSVLISESVVSDGRYCVIYNYKLESCSGSTKEQVFSCEVEKDGEKIEGFQKTTKMTIFNAAATCDDAPYGTGQVGDIAIIACDQGQEGNKSAICEETGEWKLTEDSCIITKIKELLIESEDLVLEQVPEFVANLSKAVKREEDAIADSSATISAIVDIISTIANISKNETVDKDVMMEVLQTVDVIIADEAKESWEILNADKTSNASSALLGSMETLSSELTGEFNITTQNNRIMLNRTQFNNSFNADLNFSLIIDIPDTNLRNVHITTILFPTLNNVMPARTANDTNFFNATSNQTESENAINAAVLLVKVDRTIENVTLSYDKLNNSLTLDPQCVFWNFTLFQNFGAWDEEGCMFISDINNTVTCSCNHLTSFSILMATNVPQSIREVLDVITYVGVGISMASLVICLIIEGYVWKAITKNSTAFMRHVAIVNTALSLLIANICFIIGAAIAKNPLENPGENYEVPVGPCSTATFFMHFFYLALFFWMLVSGLLLFYRTVMVFSHMSKSTMLGIGFTLGYVCPLIIAVITVAVTAPGNGYIRKYNACWLNWTKTKALLALVIPALTIVFINILIVIVVLFKMLRRGVGDAAQREEKHTLVVLARCVIILTPLFGLTWSLGVGTMISSTNKGIHIAFAFFNSLQGFFILVFGTLYDSKIRALLSRQQPSSSTGSNPTTRSTSGGITNLSGLNLVNRLRGRRHIYHVSGAANSSSTGPSESYVNI